MPTRAPTISPAPTFDPLVANCTIKAEIFCETLRNGRPIGTCDGITDPNGVACTNGATPTSLSFIYRGNKCPTTQNGFSCQDRSADPLPNQVFNSIVGEEELTSTFVASLDTVINAEGDFATATITISFVVNNEAGAQLQTITVDGTCEDDTLTLGLTVGALDLIGFQNEAGSFTSVYPLQLTYVVANGPLNSVIDSAVIDSDFQPAVFNAIESPQTARPQTAPGGARLIVFTDTTVVDTAEKFANNIKFNFAITATATALASGNGCSAETSYSF